MAAAATGVAHLPNTGGEPTGYLETDPAELTCTVMGPTIATAPWNVATRRLQIRRRPQAYKYGARVSVAKAGSSVSYVVPPLVRKVKPRQPDLAHLPADLCESVATALASTPIDPATGHAIDARLRRVFLGPKAMPWDAGNAFFRRTRARPDSTEAVYASAVRMWAESCASQGTDPLAMNFDTLLEYRDDVRLDLDGVSGGTWNHNLSALTWFAETAHSVGLMDPIPAADWKALRLTDPSVRWPRVLDPWEYRRFRAVGLQGLTIDGKRGPAAQAIRTPVRDALFADFLVLHGTRRAEATHLTLLDLPLRRRGYARNVGYLPPNICKWGSGRDLEEVRSWADRLARYHDTEWLTTVDEAQRNLRRARNRGELVVVTAIDDRFARNTKLAIASGGTRNLVNLTKEQRRALVCTAGMARKLGSEDGMGRGLLHVEDGWLVPLAVFPGVRAPMLAPEAWSMAFREANARLAAAVRERGAAPPRRVTPHMLRHTFATEWLSAELERIAEDDRAFANAVKDGDLPALRRRHFNPLVRMMRLLGHRSLTTTLLYIDYLMREQQSAIAPGDSWIESFIGGA